MSTAALYETAFDPIRDAQALFRQLLEATARPGRVLRMVAPPLAVPPSRLRPACALLLAALDVEVGVHVLGPGAAEVAGYLCLNTGARMAPLEEADFVLVTAGESGGRLFRIKRGSLEAPHEGATVVYAPDTLEAPPGPGTVRLSLSGPGIAGTAPLAVAGISPAEFAGLQALADFPMGVDLWLAAADGTLAVIPRSTRWTLRG
jgi:alpha-D-ribose 1-methylphosphonate 5-triphosphate synthase subunit PhnH